MKIIVQEIGSVDRRLREAEQKITILCEIARYVSSLLDVQLVLDAIVQLLWKEFSLDACSIRLLDADGKLRIKSQKGLSRAFTEKATREPTIDCYSGECFLTGRIVIINDSDRIEKPISTTRLVGEDIKSFAVVPIKVENETIGVLATGSKKKNYFHERFNDLIYVIANQIGIAIKISQLYEEIHNLNQGLEEKVRERTAELEERTQQLIAAERLATTCEMSNRVAHELRNSLTVVGGLARRLHDKPFENERRTEYLKIIFEEVKTLEEKVSKLIRLGAGE
ncbi:MAG: GAF domain-containing protein [Desulfobacterales bacterium]|nr:GAF domain-containing protein [Desulfobacterales bacterium]